MLHHVTCGFLGRVSGRGCSRRQTQGAVSAVTEGTLLGSLLIAMVAGFTSGSLNAMTSHVPNTPTEQEQPDRKPDVLFSEVTSLSGRNVSCANTPNPAFKFASDTWSCYNMQIDGMRLLYHYIPGFGAETNCGAGQQSENWKNDIAALCRELLKAHDINRELWAAYINDASCGHSTTDRITFQKSNGNFTWKVSPAGKGYVKTLRCMALE